MDERLIKRFWEVDMLRGIAIVLMILYHLAFDLDYFGVVRIDASYGFPLALARLTVSLFLLLVGLSLSLSRSRALLLGQEKNFVARVMKRSLRILAMAFGISAVTYLLIGRGFIIFGALHLIGLSLLLAYPFLGMEKKNFIFGSLSIALGLYLEGLSIDNPWLLWLGLAPVGFYSLDYVPVFPWFGVVLIGMGLGDLLYPGYRRRQSFLDQLTISECSWISLLCYLGRNSLAIYLVHQPLIISLLILAGVPLHVFLNQ
jgi:uncharacterized membrane protein